MEEEEGGNPFNWAKERKEKRRKKKTRPLIESKRTARRTATS
jgi:hypothetical protein